MKNYSVLLYCESKSESNDLFCLFIYTGGVGVGNLFVTILH